MRFIPEGFTLASRNGATCSICGSLQRPLDTCDPNGPRERVISTDITIEWEGSFDVCETCVKELAKLIGYVPAERVQLAENDTLHWQGIAEQLDVELRAKQQVVDLLTSELAGTAGRAAHAYAAGYDSRELEEREEPDFGRDS